MLVQLTVCQEMSSATLAGFPTIGGKAQSVERFGPRGECNSKIQGVRAPQYDPLSKRSVFSRICMLVIKAKRECSIVGNSHILSNKLL